MKQSILSLAVLLAVIFAFSCNTSVEPNAKNSSARTAAVTTQKVILLYSNYSIINKNQDIMLIDGNNTLTLPVTSLLDGKALFGSNNTNNFQGTLLFKDQGTTYTQISNFLQAGGVAGYSFNKLLPDGSAGIVVPRNPPGCGLGGACPGRMNRQMYTMEVNIAVPITVEAITR
jgi:hypothetical protein